MKRKRRAAAPLRRGPAVLLGDGCLLLLVLAGTVFSFLTAFSVQIHALPLLLGCAAAALAFLGLWSLPAAGGPFPWPCWPPPGSWRCGGCGSLWP